MNKYLCTIVERDDINAKSKNMSSKVVEVEGYTRDYAVRMAEIYFPDCKVLKVSRKIASKMP